MRTFIQLAFTFFIAFSIVSCGGDAKSSDQVSEKTSNSDNAEKPVPTFKMANDKSNSGTTKPVTSTKVPGSGNNIAAKNPIKPATKTASTNVMTDGQILSSVPSACALISVDQIAKILGVPAEIIKQNDASHTKSPYTRSCFFRWDGASANTGILLQVQANPVQEEYAEWVSLFVSSKRTSGEKAMGTNETFKYDKLEGLGDDGSYSHRLGKYIWRDGNKYAFMIAFNTNSAADVQMKNAKSIGKIMMENYKKL